MVLRHVLSNTQYTGSVQLFIVYQAIYATKSCQLNFLLFQKVFKGIVNVISIAIKFLEVEDGSQVKKLYTVKWPWHQIRVPVLAPHNTKFNQIIYYLHGQPCGNLQRAVCLAREDGAILELHNQNHFLLHMHGVKACSIITHAIWHWLHVSSCHLKTTHLTLVEI